MKRWIPVLNFLRLLDDSGLLSLTQLAVWVLVVKIAITSPLDFSDAAALFTAIAAYNFKKYLSHDKAKREDSKVAVASKAELDVLRDDVSKLKLYAGLTRDVKNPIRS